MAGCAGVVGGYVTEFGGRSRSRRGRRGAGEEYGTVRCSLGSARLGSKGEGDRREEWNNGGGMVISGEVHYGRVTKWQGN